MNTPRCCWWKTAILTAAYDLMLARWIIYAPGLPYRAFIPVIIALDYWGNRAISCCKCKWIMSQGGTFSYANHWTSQRLVCPRQFNASQMGTRDGVAVHGRHCLYHKQKPCAEGERGDWNQCISTRLAICGLSVISEGTENVCLENTIIVCLTLIGGIKSKDNIGMLEQSLCVIDARCYYPIASEQAYQRAHLWLMQSGVLGTSLP
jgi:hypothetical protein